MHATQPRMPSWRAALYGALSAGHVAVQGTAWTASWLAVGPCRGRTQLFPSKQRRPLRSGQPASGLYANRPASAPARRAGPARRCGPRTRRACCPLRPRPWPLPHPGAAHCSGHLCSAAQSQTFFLLSARGARPATLLCNKPSLRWLPAARPWLAVLLYAW